MLSPVTWEENDQFMLAKSLKANVKIAAIKSFSRILSTSHTYKANTEPHLTSVWFILSPSQVITELSYSNFDHK
jgi:hypothetical protein